MIDAAPLANRIRFTPAPYDADAAARAAEAVRGQSSLEVSRFVAGVAGCSPYLARLIEKDPASTLALFARAPEETLRRAGEKAWRAAEEVGAPAQMKALRAAKAEAALAIAFAEISDSVTTMEAARLYSAFADAATGAAARAALKGLERSGFRPADAAAPEMQSGLAIIAMGKLGASELNFSSDIDIVILFDNASPALGADGEARARAVAAAKLIVRLLNEQTADGYVFRTDIRLRPDPGVSAAAVSLNAAEAYYQSFGQNWERAAFIKARASAGDIVLGQEFIGRLRPFIWRKYLDFAQIDDIHSILRQIRAVKGMEAIDFSGADLKRGPGGIREIEFFAQGQQLIGGGKNAALRAPATLDALAALSEAGVIDKATADGLSARYRYLRRVEHRLQMIADEQTHRIPPDKEGAARLAAFLGEASAAAFERSLLDTFRTVRELTAPFYEPKGRRAGASSAALNFDGVDNHPDTMAALAARGFERPAQVADAIRRWRAGETRATRSERSRALIAQMTPQLIDALARAGAPDEAFAAFDGFIRSLPSGVQIFSLFVNRPDVFDRLIRIMTASPFLAREAAKKPHLVEALLESRWPDRTPTRDELGARLVRRMAAADGYEGGLNAARRWASEENFAVAAQLLIETISPREAGARFTLIAEAAIEAMLAAARDETERLYGPIDAEVVVVALGRLGARAMTAASDVDLLVIYDAADTARAGGAGIDAVTWASRLVRRFLAAVSTPTEEGALYEVDMQLRPSGSKGPAAVSLSAFCNYHRGEAWTWEKMALVKARVIAGSPALGGRVAAEIDTILRSPRDAGLTARDVADMRRRLSEAKPATSPWDLKTASGGATDVDFIVQYLTLAAAPAGALVVHPEPLEALGALEAIGALEAPRAALLLDAHAHFDAVTQVARASSGGAFAPGGSAEPVRRMMIALFGASSLPDAEQRLIDLENRVRSVYEDVVVKAGANAEPGEGR
ncbi:MAG: bifunctional [glutamine synthetase] adenylyltransferase/[glutamine synthetase]-adenylyl-L-tyrosine phosphorylase [Parvularculaceae bacterium]|nr:bifunctional [glutamine synthetase] adenylyltransferase/[glutamine synthetase]-adenylyl-L-tyrosine phosphorylase [Parvularculaceae bacterium]